MNIYIICFSKTDLIKSELLGVVFKIKKYTYVGYISFCNFIYSSIHTYILVHSRQCKNPFSFSEKVKKRKKKPFCV